MTVRLYLVRHGQTDMNKTNRLQGITDRPLSARGVKQAQSLAALLAEVPFIAAYSSDRLRAVQTAQAILQYHPNLVLHQRAGLREYYFGGLEGQGEGLLMRHTMQAVGAKAMMRAFKGDRFAHLIATFQHRDPTKQAESLAEVQLRVRTGLAKIVAEAPADADVLVVAHGLLLSALVHQLAPDQLPFGLLKNTSVTRIDVDQNQWQVVGVNLTQLPKPVTAN